MMGFRDKYRSVHMPSARSANESSDFISEIAALIPPLSTIFSLNVGFADRSRKHVAACCHQVQLPSRRPLNTPNTYVQERICMHVYDEYIHH